MRLHCLLATLLICFMSAYTHAQHTNTTLNQVVELPSSFYNNISEKAARLDERLTRQTEKFLQQMLTHERRLKKKLQRKDSTLAKSMFSEAPDKYQQLINKLHAKSYHPDPRMAGDYLPQVDSMNMVLSFMQKNSAAPAHISEAAGALQQMRGVQEKLIYVQQIRKFIRNRKAFLAEQLGPQGLSSQLKHINKEAYYYSQYIQETKNILNDPSKLERAALQVLHKVPAFNDYVAKNSFLHSLFGAAGMASPAAGNNVLSVPGLQTRNEVTQLVNTNMISSSGAGGQDAFGQQLTAVKNELKGLQSKVSQWDDDAELPNFKPNTMRSRSFIQRLEFGSNLQVGKTNNWAPSSADIAGQVAYKFHQHGSAGFGAAYRLGFGSLRAVSFSHQGLGLRSFLDYKLKGSFFINGGLEYNYNAVFKNVEELRRFNAWQSSALLGVSKKYKVSKKIKGNLVLLYDLLAKSHTPNTQPIVFRFGYTF